MPAAIARTATGSFERRLDRLDHRVTAILRPLVALRLEIRVSLILIVASRGSISTRPRIRRTKRQTGLRL